jgi:lysophospholipase L1-like esterase
VVEHPILQARKLIVLIGDSLTWGKVNGDTSWTDYLQTNYGCTTRNYGVSGRTMQHTSTVYSSVYDNYASMNTDADIVILWAGFNDITLSLQSTAQLGVFTDRVSTTYYGSLHLILNGLQSMYQGKKIFICTLMDTNHSWDTVKLWNQAIREVAEYYGVPILELARASINARNTDLKTTYIPDGIHPNNAGNLLLSDVVAKFINSH